MDLTEPFHIDGGALVIYNKSMDTDAWSPEHSGPDIAAIGMAKALRTAPISRAWLDPPPLDPNHPERIQAWRKAAIRQMREGLR